MRVAVAGGGLLVVSQPIQPHLVGVTGPDTCPSALFIGVRGSGETSTDAGGYGTTINGVLSALQAIDPSVNGVAIDYQALGVRWYDPRYYDYRYNNSIGSGIASLLAEMSAFTAACHRSRIYLAGYSQGAQVVGDAYLGWLSDAEKARVTRVALIGDPKFMGGQGAPVDVGTYNKHLNGIATLTGSHHSWSGADSAKVRSYCANGDPVCNFSSLGQAAGCGLHKSSCPHTHYTSNIVPALGITYAQAAARFLAGSGGVPGGGGPGGNGPTGGGSTGGSPSGGGPGLYDISGHATSPGITATWVSSDTSVKQVGDSQIGAWFLRNDGVVTQQGGFGGSYAPVQTSLTNVSKIATEGFGATVLFLMGDGTVEAEGDGQYGQLGDGQSGSGVYATTPVVVSGLHNVVDIAVGDGNGFAVEADGSVWEWGANDVGQLGPAYSNLSIATTPLEIPNLPPALSVASNEGGGPYVLARDGEVFSWGCPNSGTTGNGAGQNPDGSLRGLPAIRSLTSHDGEVIAIGVDGSTYFWGRNNNGGLANGNRSGETTIPTLIPLPKSAVASGFDLDWPLVVQLADGSVYAWGGICADGCNDTPANIVLPGPATVVGGGYVVAR